MNTVQNVKEARVFIDAPLADTSSTAFAEGIVWLGQRLLSATACKGRFGRRERMRFERMIRADGDMRVVLKAMAELFKTLGLRHTRSRAQPAEVELPMVAVLPGIGFRFVYAIGADDAWLAEGPLGRERIAEWPPGSLFLAATVLETVPEEATANALFQRIFAADRSWIFQSALASTLASILVLATSLYSMQIYDRVIGQGGVATLIVLSVGVLIAIVVEFSVKVARSAIVDRALHAIDVECAQGVFDRMLGVRLDQLPPSVGTLAAQVRGFEVVRGFRAASMLYFITDAPFALLFLVIIYFLGGAAVAAVPAVASIVAVGIGLSFKHAIQRHSTHMDLVGNKRQGLLVEAIQGTELLKSSGGDWRMQARWKDLSRQTSEEAMHIKHLNELAGYCAGVIQQVSYVALVGAGAYIATTSNELTIGAIIACSIVSGRVLTPINQIPGLLVQWAHARAAQDNLEKLFALQQDNHGVETPLVPDLMKGDLEVADIEFAYTGQARALTVGSLKIAHGERVAVLGSIGSGKSTLLRLLAGLVKAERGRVLVDGLDIHQIAAERRAELIGYLPQATQLISGTLRENLTLGLHHVREERILAAAQATGLTALLASRPEGLDIRISEGGEGLSGGQKQLVCLTRVLLAEPMLWLLDEPTAAMDDGTEETCMQALRSSILPGQTLVLVTHKLRLLEFVDRIVVLTPKGIIMDGPRDAVIDRLRQPTGSNGGKGFRSGEPVPDIRMRPMVVGSGSGHPNDFGTGVRS